MSHDESEVVLIVDGNAEVVSDQDRVMRERRRRKAAELERVAQQREAEAQKEKDEEENDKCESLSASLSRVHFSAHFIQSIMESDYLLSSSQPTNFSLPFDFIK